MDARLCWVCEESDCWKVIWDRCSGGVKTLKDFVIFGGFEVQRVWESSVLYIPTLIDPESDNLIERHRGHL